MLEKAGRRIEAEVVAGKATRRAGTQSRRLAAGHRVRQLAAILDASTDAIVSVDLDRVIRTWNPAATQLFGYSPREAIGRKADELIVPEDLRAQVLKTQPAMRATKKAAIFESLRAHKDGSLIAVEVNVLPMFDFEGNVTDVSVIYRDIRERIVAARSLRDSEERYRTLVTSIDDGFCIVDMIFDRHRAPIDYRFLEVNPSFESQSGLHGALGRRMRELAPDHEAHWFEKFGKVSMTGQAIRFVEQAKAMQGRWFDVYACRIGESGNGKVAILFSDITDRRRTEDALRDNQAKLQLAVAVAGIGVGVIDYASDRINLDEAAAALFDLPANLPMPRVEVHARFHPDDAAMIAANLRAGHDPAGTGSLAFDHRIALPDGTTRWVSARKQVQFARNADGRKVPVSGFLAVRDVTARADATAALRASELLTRQVLESSPDCVKVLDAQGRIEFINFNGCALMEIDERCPVVGAQWDSMWPQHTTLRHLGLPIVVGTLAFDGTAQVIFDPLCERAERIEHAMRKCRSMAIGLERC